MFTPIRFAVGIGMMLYLSAVAITESNYALLTINLVQLLGIIFNATVVLSNGLKMPVKVAEGESVWDEVTHTPMTSDTRFALFADRYRFAGRCFSLGDFYIITGIALFLLYVFCHLISL